MQKKPVHTNENTIDLPAAAVSRMPCDIPVTIADIAIQTVLDDAFFSETFAVTPDAHSHPYYELHISISGEYAITFLDYPTVVMKPSMVCLIPPSLGHSTQRISAHPQKLAVRFSYRHTRPMGDVAPLYTDFHRALERLHSPLSTSVDVFYQLVLALRRETLYHGQGSDVMEQHLLGQLYIHLLRILLPEKDAGKENHTISDNMNVRYIRIDRFLSENCCRNLTQQDLADYLSLSRRQTGRILQTIYGMGFQDKLTEMRLVRAAELLTRTMLPLEGIAREVGYSSYSGFYTAFRRHFGMSAREYRMQNENKNLL